MLKTYFPSYTNVPSNVNIIIEHTLRYADVDEMKELISKYGIQNCKTVWMKYLVPDLRIIKLNHFLAKFIFGLSEEDLSQLFKLPIKNRIDRIPNVSNK